MQFYTNINKTEQTSSGIVLTLYIPYLSDSECKTDDERKTIAFENSCIQRLHLGHAFLEQQISELENKDEEKKDDKTKNDIKNK